MRAGILRILQISRAGGTPLPMAGRLTQLAKIFPVIYNLRIAIPVDKTILHWYAPTAQCIAKNRRRAVSYVSTGLARLPRDTDAHATTAEVRL